MPGRLNVSHMQINHSCRNTCMSESFLHVQDTLPVFEEMSSRTVSESMNGDGGVEAGLDQRILKNPPYISLIDTLRCDTPSMSLEDKVVTGILFSERFEYDEELFGDGDISVLQPLPLTDEEHFAFEADVLPSELAGLTDPECAVVDNGQKRFVIQTGLMQDMCHMVLGENSGELFGLADLRQNKPVRLFDPHDLVIDLESEDHVLEIGHAVSLLVNQHREIPLNVVLGKVIGEFFVEEYRLRNLQAIIINTVVCILCEMQLFSKQLNAVPEFGYSRNGLVQNCIRHIFGW